MKNRKLTVQIFHLVTDSQADIPNKCLQVASACCPEKFGKPILRPMFEVQYNEFRIKVSRKFKRVDDLHNVIMFGNGRYMLINEVLEMLPRESCPVMILNQLPFEPSWTRNLFNPYVVKPERDYIFMNIHISGEHLGFMIIEIFSDLNPKLSNCFVNIFKQESITIGHYSVFKDGWLEFGMAPKSMPMRGNNHHATMSHNRRGILSFSAEYNFECDAFFIHFIPCTYFDDLRTVLGRVVHGDKILHKIEELESEYGKLKNELLIYGCGIVPIGKNFPDNLDDEEDWEKTICQLFGEKVSVTRSKSIGGVFQNKSASDIACATFQTDVQEQSDLSQQSFSTPQTVLSWDNINKTNLMFYYSEEMTNLPMEHSTNNTVKTCSNVSKLSNYSSDLSLNEALVSQFKQNKYSNCTDVGCLAQPSVDTDDGYIAAPFVETDDGCIAAPFVETDDGYVAEPSVDSGSR